MHSSLTRQPSSLFNSYKIQQSSSPNIQYRHDHRPLIQTTASHFHTNAANHYYHQHHGDSTTNCLSNQIPHEMTSNIMEKVNIAKSLPIKRTEDDGGGDGEGGTRAEQVVVNSILYKKASSSRIVVDIGAQIAQALLMGNHRHHCEHQSTSTDTVNNSFSSYQNKQRAYMSDLKKLLSCEQQNNNVAEWYVMSTTINGSVEHHITGFCANLLNVILKGNKHNGTQDKVEDNGTDDSEADSLIQRISHNDDAENCVDVSNISFNCGHDDEVESDTVDSDDDDDSFIQFISDDEYDCGIIQESFPHNIDEGNLSRDVDFDDMLSEDENDDDDEDHDEVAAADYARELNQDFGNPSNNMKQSINFSDLENQHANNNAIDTTDGEVCMPNTYTHISQLNHRLQLQTRMGGVHFNDKRRKKVCFNNQPVVHVMRTWDYAYRAARKGHWEMYARDRARFMLRIERIAEQLEPILQAEHRHKVYYERFVPFYQQQASEKQMPSNVIESTQYNKQSGEVYVKNVDKDSDWQRRQRRKSKEATTLVLPLSTAVEADAAETNTKLALLKCKRDNWRNRYRRRRRFKTPVVLFYCYIF